MCIESDIMERDLGHRRVQITGRGTFIISLPKDWADDVGLEKGSEVAFQIRDDNSLTLIPDKMMGGREVEGELKEYFIPIKHNENPQSVCHKITSLYVISADLIHLTYKDGEFLKYKSVIRDLVRNELLGSEIIEERPNEITIQILINHPDFPVEKAIRRMAIIALSANRIAILALKDIDNDFQNVYDANNDIKRLTLYVIRQLKYGLEKNLYKEYGFNSPKEFLGYRIVVNDVKSIATNAVNIIQNISRFKKLVRDKALFLKETVDEEVYSQVINFNSSTEQIFEESLKSMFKRNYEKADEIILKIKSFAEIENDLITLISSKKMDPNISSILRLILDNPRRILEYSQNIADVTLNRTIEDSIETPSYAV